MTKEHRLIYSPILNNEKNPDSMYVKHVFGYLTMASTEQGGQSFDHPGLLLGVCRLQCGEEKPKQSLAESRTEFKFGKSSKNLLGRVQDRRELQKAEEISKQVPFESSGSEAQA